MKPAMRKYLYGLVVGMTAIAASSTVNATGMQPATSVVIVYEADGEASLTVKNTEDVPSLLYTSIENIPEDTESLLVLTPPVARVEAGDTQLVRFLLEQGKTQKVQRLKRVIFEGITPRPSKTGNATVGVTVRQNIPLIVHPKGLERNREPWKLLQWSVNEGKLTVANNSPYVVRLAAEVVVNPSGKTALLPRPYILPGETLGATMAGNVDGRSVTISPATVYGFSTDKYEASIDEKTR